MENVLICINEKQEAFMERINDTLKAAQGLISYEGGGEPYLTKA